MKIPTLKPNEFHCVECLSPTAKPYFGLCETCQETRDIFAEYTERRKQPPEACPFLPHSKEKMECMTQRWLWGFLPHHPDDAQLPPDERKTRSLEYDVYAKLSDTGGIKYHSHTYEDGVIKNLGNFTTVREARRAAEANRERVERKRLVEDGEVKASGWGVLKWHKKFWKAFTVASQKRDVALTKMPRDKSWNDRFLDG